MRKLLSYERGSARHRVLSATAEIDSCQPQLGWPGLANVSANQSASFSVRDRHWLIKPIEFEVMNKSILVEITFQKCLGGFATPPYQNKCLSNSIVSFKVCFLAAKLWLAVVPLSTNQRARRPARKRTKHFIGSRDNGGGAFTAIIYLLIFIIESHK